MSADGKQLLDFIALFRGLALSPSADSEHLGTRSASQLAAHFNAGLNESGRTKSAQGGASPAP